jgi:nitrate reductase assembly molybdenum cofactor insertion protein NarJ
METPDHLAAMAEARASRAQAEADLAAVRARAPEVTALVKRLRELQDDIPAIVRNLLNRANQEK